MANLKSSKKDIRRTVKRTLQNKSFRDGMKAAVKTLRQEVAKNQVGKDSVSIAQKAIDKAAKRGIIKKQTASRLKSRLMKVNKA